MFSGIVEEIGTVVSMQQHDNLLLWNGEVAAGYELAVAAKLALEDTVQHPRQLIVRPWQWRRQTITSFHLSANIDAHNTRFEQGYDDAKLHHHELALLLPAKDTCGQGA
ncbi:hypothetical protein ABG067_001079 [Albugo candida]